MNWHPTSRKTARPGAPGVEAMRTAAEYGDLGDLVLCCLLSVVLASSTRSRRTHFAIVLPFLVAACLLSSVLYITPLFIWDAAWAGISLTVHSTFSTSYPAVLRDIAVFLYVLFRVWRREDGLSAVLKHWQNAKDAVLALAASFLFVFGYHSIVLIPKFQEEARKNISAPPEGRHALPPSDALQRAPVEEAHIEPQVEMYFVNPNNVEWRIKNGPLMVQNVIYWFALMDIDQPLLPNNPPGYPGIFQIPSGKIDFINANDFSGALVLPPYLKGIKLGDRIFGTAQVSCPGCKDKAYWVYFRQGGGGGWFSKIHGHTSRGLLFPAGEIEANPDKKMEDLVPSNTRTIIKDEKVVWR